MIFLSTYRNKRRWIAAAGMTIWLMSAYVWMLDEIPGTVCVSDGQPLNITEGLPVTLSLIHIWLAQAQKDVEKISERALEGVASLSEENVFLNELIRYLIHRKK